MLPSLGEDAVVQTTLADLVPEVEPAPVQPVPAQRSGAGTAVAGPAFAERTKGDARMADVLARAVAQRRHSAPGDLEATIGLRRLVVRAMAVNEALEGRLAGGSRMPAAGTC